MGQSTRNLRHAAGQWLEIFLDESTTTDATPVVIYTSTIDIPELRLLEIDARVLVRNTTTSAVATFRKRGLYTRAVGGNLRLVNSARTEFLGEVTASDVDVIYGLNAQRFTVSARGAAGTTYIWTSFLEVLRNNS
jgi:hypothetical protein